MSTDSKKPVRFFHYAYTRLLPEFISSFTEAGRDSDALSSATAKLVSDTLGLSEVPHSFAMILADYTDLKGGLDTKYFESSVVSIEDFKPVLDSTVEFLVNNPIESVESCNYSTINNNKTGKAILPDTLMVIPIRSATATCGYAVVYYHAEAEHYTVDSPQMTFLSKVVYLVALTFQSEISSTMFEHYLMNDHLTELPNRDHLYEAIIYMLQSAAAFSNTFAILIIRVNGLKSINNSLGIITGDLMLKAMGALIESTVSEGAVFETLVGRFSGGDFAVLITLPADYSDINEVGSIVSAYCNAIIGKTEHHVEINGYKLYPSVNIGASIYPYHGETAEELLRKADLAKNSAKSVGPGTFKIYESYMDGDAEEILFLNSNLPTAISANQFEMYYQALVDIKAGKVLSAEALIRWNHPERGLITPAFFMPFAEKNAYGIQIDLLVLNMACEQINKWKAKGINIVISVNISPRHFVNGLIFDSVSKVLANNAVQPSSLRLEILEGILLDDYNSAIKVINDLRSLGVGIALDDFGTGYSSLEYVAKLPMDYLKIDRSFSMNIVENPSNKVVLETIMTMAGGMKVKTIAEGVEGREQFDFLSSIGCDIAQGYFINKPMDVKSFEAFLGDDCMFTI